MGDSENQYQLLSFARKNKILYNVTPSNWIIDSNLCWWPKSTKNITNAIVKRMEPDQETWDRYTIRGFHGMYCSYTEARSAEKEATASTDEESVKKSRAGRKIRPNKQYSQYSVPVLQHDTAEGQSDCDSDGSLPSTNNNESDDVRSEDSLDIAGRKAETILQKEIVKATQALSVTSHRTSESNEDPLDIAGSKAETILQKEIVKTTKALSLTSDITPASNNDLLNIAGRRPETMVQQIRSKALEIEVGARTDIDIETTPILLSDQILLNGNPCELQGLGQKIDSIEKKINDMKSKIDIILELVNTREEMKPRNYQDSNLEVKKYLPLKNLEDLIEFDEKLKSNKEFRDELFTFLRGIGGSDCKNFIKRCLTVLLTNNLAEQCSWTGQKSNFRIAEMNCMETLKNAVKSQYDATDKQFENVVADWCRFAKQRSRRSTLNN